jgi:hypothetical protein
MTRSRSSTKKAHQCSGCLNIAARCTERRTCVGNGESVTQTTQSNTASGPTGSGPSAAGPAAGTPPQKNGGGSGRITLRLSVIALLVSALSIGLSILALITVGSNDSATPLPQTGETAPAPSTIPAESTAPSETASAPEENTSLPASDAPLPTASANYTVSYEGKRLTLQPNAPHCAGNDRVVDLDQPAINVTTGGDLQYSPSVNCDGQPSLRFASNKVATVVSADATPQDCASAIQLSPASQEIAASQDLVLCAVTDGEGAPNEPARAKIARIVVTGVGQEQKVALTVTAWEIPH